jgi:FKBP-type peptidyl-prolyl cis-trans isomerase (trigger factor)
VLTARKLSITQLPDDNGKKVLRAEADWTEIASDYDDIIASYSPVQIPGFRPGRVPRAVIEKRFRQEIVNELEQRTAQRLGREVLSASGAEAMGPIEINDIECGKGKPFRFTARFWLMPEITLPDLGSLALGDDGLDPRDRISQRLLEQVSFDVPDELVEAEAGDDGTNAKGCAAWEAASDRLRLMLILKRIAAREGIEVSPKDVELRITEKAAEFGMDTDSLKEELHKGGGTARLQNMLLAESTLEYLIELNQQR